MAAGDGSELDVKAFADGCAAVECLPRVAVLHLQLELPHPAVRLAYRRPVEGLRLAEVHFEPAGVRFVKADPDLGFGVEQWKGS